MKMVNVLHFTHVIDRDECTMRYVQTYGKARFYSFKAHIRSSDNYKYKLHLYNV